MKSKGKLQLYYITNIPHPYPTELCLSTDGGWGKGGGGRRDGEEPWAEFPS